MPSSAPDTGRLSAGELAARFWQSALPQAAFDEQGVVTDANDAYLRLFDLTAEEVVGAPVLRGSPQDELPGNEALLDDFLSGRTRHLLLERRLQRRDGTLVHVAVAADALAHEEGRSFAVFVHDISALVAVREQLRRGEARWQALAEQATDLGHILDADARLTYVSPAAAALFGYDSAEVLLASGFSFVHPDDAPLLRRALEEVLAGADRQVEVTLRIRHADGTYRVVQDRLRNMLHVPGVEGIVANLRDVTLQHAAEEQLRALAVRDPSTGLPNRALLEDRLGRLAEEQAGGTVGLVVLSLPDLAGLTGELGHGAAEALVAQVAGRLQGLLEPGDTLARVDPGVLALARPAVVPVHDVAALVEEVGAALAAPLEVGGRLLSPQRALGTAERAHERATEALGDALLAARWSSVHRGGRVVAFEPSLRLDALRRRDLAQELRADLPAGRVRPWYQPLVDLETGRPVGFEALARWQRPDGEVQAPGTFFGVAEEAGLLRALSDRVLRRACAEAACWPQEHGYLSVNVTAEQLLDPSFEAGLVEALELSGLPPARLVLELTEQGVLTDVDRARQVLASLRVVGVRTALDDFGTGWSSMLQLTSLPVDVVKIDRVFVAGMLQDRAMRLVVTSTLDLARSLGATAVAEGVERPEQAVALRELGCAVGQGYLFSAAVPLDRVEGVVRGAAPPPAAAVDRQDRAAVERARQLQAAGLSLHTVAAALNREGVAAWTGRRWTSRRVAELLADDEAGT